MEVIFMEAPRKTHRVFPTTESAQLQAALNRMYDLIHMNALPLT